MLLAFSYYNNWTDLKSNKYASASKFQFIDDQCEKNTFQFLRLLALLIPPIFYKVSDSCILKSLSKDDSNDVYFCISKQILLPY